MSFLNSKQNDKGGHIYPFRRREDVHTTGVIWIKGITLIALLCCLSIHHLVANVTSTSGNISFVLVNHGGTMATLNTQGLGLGVSEPSAQLHVAGNAVMERLSIGTTISQSNLHISGTFAQSFQTLGAGSNTLSSHSMVFADSSTGNIRITLPSAQAGDGQCFKVKKTSSQHTLSITTVDGSIDGQEFSLINSGNLSYQKFLSSGNQWYIMESSGHEHAYSNNLLANFRLNESSGNTALDSVGAVPLYGMGSFSFSGCTSTGALGKALSFDGGEDRLIAASQSSLVSSTNTMTLSVWVKPYRMDGNMVVLRKNHSYDIRVLGSDKYWARVYSSHGDSGGGNASGNKLSVNSWNLLSVVVSHGYVHTYLNGQLERSDLLDGGSESDPIKNNSNTDLYLGDSDANGASGTNNYHGEIDDFRVYDRAFSSEEILQMYQWFK